MYTDKIYHVSIQLIQLSKARLPNYNLWNISLIHALVTLGQKSLSVGYAVYMNWQDTYIFLIQIEDNYQ